MLKCALLIPDCHRPFHDKRAYNLMLKVASDCQIDEVVILGDYADIYHLSSHGKHPGVLTTLIEEIEDTNRGLDEIDKLFPKAKKFYLQGNHEYRFERYINEKCPELFGITQFDHLLMMPERGLWKYINYGPNQKHRVLGSYLTARHEPIGRTAELTARKAMCSLVYGHIHRIQSSYAVGMDGTQHVAYSCGWLGDKSFDKIFGYVKSHHDWQLGFSMVYVDSVTGHFYHHIIPIFDNYTCVFNGKLYK